ncbi:MAG: hypothetical protein V4750_14745, partial [Pseudomonadota bacterium]
MKPVYDKFIKDPKLQAEIAAAIRSLLFQPLDALPRKLKFHQLHNKQVTSILDKSKKVSAWSFHVTTNDVYKASCTFEDGIVHLRLCDEHDVIDKNP